MSCWCKDEVSDDVDDHVCPKCKGWMQIYSNKKDERRQEENMSKKNKKENGKESVPVVEKVEEKKEEQKRNRLTNEQVTQVKGLLKENKSVNEICESLKFVVPQQVRKIRRHLEQTPATPTTE